ncbi:MAG: Trigger factor [Phycisphaerae bacterium]|nr:Trigger factor [Phycisphaerae bacterium]
MAEESDKDQEPKTDAADETAEAEDNLPPIAVTVEDLGALRKKLLIAVPRERIDAKRDESIKQLASTQQVPGFRIGRAPRRLIEKRFGAELNEDLKTQMIALGYTKAVEQEKLKVLGDPDMDDEKLDAITLPEEGPLTFDVTVEVQPEFELPDLDNIPVKRPPAAVSDAEVQQAIDRWRGNFATVEPVDGPAALDDIVVADVAFQPEGGETHTHANQQVPVRPQAVEGVPLEDLGDKLTGAKPGDVVTIETTVPDGHPQEALRGKKATFTFTAREVKRTRLPEVDEQFVARFGFDKVEEFREWIGSQLASEAENVQKRQMREQVYDYLLAGTNLELPEGVLSRMKERAVQRRANELMMRGVPRDQVAKHEDELEVAAGEEATRELKSFFILAKVAEKLEVQVAEEDGNAAIAQMAAQYGMRPDALRSELERRGSLNQLYQQILEQKAVDKLLEKAAVTDAPAEESADAKETPKKGAKKSAKKTAKKADDADDQDAT